MISILIGRLALLSALSALVLAVLWTHIRRKVWHILDTLSAYLLRALFLARGQVDRDGHLSSEQDVISRDHPRLTGRSFKRTTSESIYSAYRSLGGIGQSQAAFASGQPSSTSGAGHLSAARGHLTSNLMARASEGGQSSTFLTLFAITITTLIIYTTVKMLSTRFGRPDSRSRDGHHSWEKISSTGSRARLRRADTAVDKRKLARLNREDRVRELLRHHGGRNVSSAIRFLAGELERNKLLLIQSLTRRQDINCNCSCHVLTESAQTTPNEGTVSEKNIEPEDGLK